ncbi:MAG TPA: DUF3459 domain-containing protein, partial [Chthoniobacterales bacterium]
ATHAIVDSSPRHFLAAVAERIHSLGCFVTVEDERNEPKLLESAEDGGFGLDAFWADDFHHVVRVMLTGEREGYYRSYDGSADELFETLRDGWLLHGEKRHRKRAKEAAECAAISPEQLIFCITNHDQIGNEAFGRRLNEKVSPAAFRAASALLCLVPYTPLFFMGQEWAAETPFQFFTDHEEELGRRVTEGRRDEFKGFALFGDPAAREKIPDPQAEETFQRLKLRWDELEKEPHATTFRLYRELLRWRRSLPALRGRARSRWEALPAEDGVVRLLFGRGGKEQCLVVVNLRGGHIDSATERNAWELLLSTNEPRFGGDAAVSEQSEVRLFRKFVRD